MFLLSNFGEFGFYVFFFLKNMFWLCLTILFFSMKSNLTLDMNIINTIIWWLKHGHFLS